MRPKDEWAIDSEAMKASRNSFSKIQLVGHKHITTKHLSQLQSSFTAKTLHIWRRFSLLVDYNI